MSTLDQWLYSNTGTDVTSEKLKTNLQSVHSARAKCLGYSMVLWHGVGFGHSSFMSNV